MRKQLKRLSYLLSAIIASAAVVLLLDGCATIKMEDLPKTKQTLLIEEYFKGKSKAYGIIFDRNGVPQRQFSVDLVGSWNEAKQTLTLDEDFIFNDGENSQRKWIITKVGDTRYTGRAEDVVGEATGTSHGNAFQWRYVLNVPYKGNTLALSIDDWLYLNDDNVLINRSVMYKYGLKVGEIVISFNKK
ncbi:MAG: DUF3833 domain-containing protein [Leucothrix sp.]